MIVAFRRESDEEHLEPKFELPLPPGVNLVTERGFALIAEQIAALEAASTAASHEEARATIARDLRYWRARQISAKLAPRPAGDKVEFGTLVTIRLRGVARTFRIVGDDEADPAAGRLSFNAPLVRAMLGAEPGEWLPFAGEEDAIEILTVSA